MNNYFIEEISTDTEEYNNCQTETKTVSGFIHSGQRTEAAYFVHWIVDQVEKNGVNFDYW